MGAEATGEKRCSRCGKDVSGRSRAKDAKGDYICAECLEKARTRSQTPRQQQPGGGAVTMAGVGAAALQAPDGGADDLMSKLVQDSIEEGKQGCPNCRAGMKANQRLCVKCGYDREKGSALHTKIEKPVVIKQKTSGGTGISLSAMNPMVVAGLIIGVQVGLYLLAYFNQTNTAIAFPAIGVLMILQLLISILTLIAAFADGIGQGVLCFCVPFYIVYWAFVKSENLLIQAMSLGYWGTALLALVMPLDTLIETMNAAGQ